jgi:hypothetical protein
MNPLDFVTCNDTKIIHSYCYNLYIAFILELKL